jgi:hypothetical protein
MRAAHPTIFSILVIGDSIVLASQSRHMKLILYSDLHTVHIQSVFTSINPAFKVYRTLAISQHIHCYYLGPSRAYLPSELYKPPNSFTCQSVVNINAS